MSTTVNIARAKLRQRLHESPLGFYIDLYVTRLLKEGPGSSNAQRCLRLVVGDSGSRESSLVLTM
jgi:hypothetical protein